MDRLSITQEPPGQNLQSLHLIVFQKEQGLFLEQRGVVAAGVGVDQRVVEHSNIEGDSFHNPEAIYCSGKRINGIREQFPEAAATATC
ncbi:hypothetical protein JTE90_008152 [Oedothorax gibbosus]|uniref:Uncharacterized protein n=1 Tax=Oedothorax gibbosus TaxID=931172 RepID=A0AAV6VE56_9ARAC|nr:hypothetical protein JTE90_008152 [Oedothorax gibbosus]